MDNINNDQNINNTMLASAVAAVINKAFEMTGKKINSCDSFSRRIGLMGYHIIYQ